MSTFLESKGIRLSEGYEPDNNAADPTRSSFKKCYQLSTHADRVRHIAPADYRAGSHLRLLLEQMVEEVATRIVDRRARDLEAGTIRAPRHTD